MNTIHKLIQTHLTKYPLMEAVDMAKLLYQNELGPGHMILNETESLQRLTAEWEKLPHSLSGPFAESIGNRLTRIYLNTLKRKELPLLNAMFCQTANHVQGNKERLIQNLDSLSSYFPDAKKFLSEYKEKGYPPISHSTAYRQAYHPAYRVVMQSHATFLQLIRTLDASIKEKISLTEDAFLKEHVSLMKNASLAENASLTENAAPTENASPTENTSLKANAFPKENISFIIAIDGNCASGKTTFSSLLAMYFDCNIIHMDDFFLPPKLRTPARLAQPGGNIHYERFIEEIMLSLQNGSKISYRPFCCSTMDYADAISLPSKPLTIIEGSYSMHPKLRNLYDYSVFLSCSYEQQITRIRTRNGEASLKNFTERWIPMENTYFDTFQVKENCSFVIET